jgi:hypothetical protein
MSYHNSSLDGLGATFDPMAMISQAMKGSTQLASQMGIKIPGVKTPAVQPPAPVIKQGPSAPQAAMADAGMSTPVKVGIGVAAVAGLALLLKKKKKR